MLVAPGHSHSTHSRIRRQLRAGLCCSSVVDLHPQRHNRRRAPAATARFSAGASRAILLPADAARSANRSSAPQRRKAMHSTTRMPSLCSATSPIVTRAAEQVPLRVAVPVRERAPRTGRAARCGLISRTGAAPCLAGCSGEATGTQMAPVGSAQLPSAAS